MGGRNTSSATGAPGTVFTQYLDVFPSRVLRVDNGANATASTFVDSFNDVRGAIAWLTDADVYSYQFDEVQVVRGGQLGFYPETPNISYIMLFHVEYIFLFFFDGDEVSVEISLLTGDLSGTLHVMNYTTLNATTIGPSINASLLVYPLGAAEVPAVCQEHSYHTLSLSNAATGSCVRRWDEYYS